MTLPFGSFDPDNLPQGVVKPEELGDVLQNPSREKSRELMASRFPGFMSSTGAGGATNVDGPLGLLVDVVARFQAQVANADPADITGPDDLLALAHEVITDLPLVSLLAEIIEAIKGLFTGENPLLQALSALMFLRWAQADDTASAVVDLQDKTQKLEGVIGYACRYMSSSPGVTTSAQTMPFDTQVGPIVGVTPQSGGRFRLDSKGLWRMEAQVRFWGAVLAPPRCYMDIVIRTPAGAEFTRLKAMASSDDEITVTNVMPVVIPAAGYTAEVQAWTSSLPLAGNWRGIGGGFSTTRFSTFKISSETS